MSHSKLTSVSQLCLSQQYISGFSSYGVRHVANTAAQKQWLSFSTYFGYFISLMLVVQIFRLIDPVVCVISSQRASFKPSLLLSALPECLLHFFFLLLDKLCFIRAKVRVKGSKRFA